MRTIWVLGDQLSRRVGPLANATPGRDRVLLVEAADKIRSKRWHRQRLHLILASMRHFAAELETEGFDVDYRRATTMADGLAHHQSVYAPSEVVVMAPLNWDGRQLLERLDVTISPNDQFLCSPEAFAQWADEHLASHARLTMEDFYRWQRRRLDILIDDGQPTGGAWNFDKDNREPPPKDGRGWPEVRRFALTDIDEAVIAEIEGYDVWGEPPVGWWPTNRADALLRLGDFVEHALPTFGAHQDAMLDAEWSMSHSLLSSALNTGLLLPGEVVAAAVDAYQDSHAPINSVEGFVRQVIGWREYVLGVYWLWMPDYRDENRLAATRSLPPVFEGQASTSMACLGGVLGNLERNGWNHHIERLMVIGNLLLTAGVDPRAAVDWMWRSYVDGAEWVMLPNLIGMALHADGGRMATKPYAAGGAYINRMSNYCKGCRFDPKKRTGDDACPFSTLYWDFLAGNEEALRSNHRMGRQLGAMRKLADLDGVRERGAEITVALTEGRL